MSRLHDVVLCVMAESDSLLGFPHCHIQHVQPRIWKLPSYRYVWYGWWTPFKVRFRIKITPFWYATFKTFNRDGGNSFFLHTPKSSLRCVKKTRGRPGVARRCMYIPAANHAARVEDVVDQAMSCIICCYDSFWGIYLFQRPLIIFSTTSSFPILCRCCSTRYPYIKSMYIWDDHVLSWWVTNANTI